MNLRLWIPVAVLACGAAAAACDFCMAPLAGFGKGVRQADGVADAKVVGRQLLFVDDGAARTATTFSIGKILHGYGPEPGKTFRTTVQWRGAATATRAVLLFDRTEDGPAFLDALADPDGKLAAYFAEAFAGAKRDAAERVAFYAGHLESPDADIAEDAYQQFAGIPFDAVRQAKKSLDPAKLRAWLAAEKVPAARKGLYALMLGLVGGAGDVTLLEKLLPAAEGSAAAGGILAGECLLTGKPEELLSRTLADAKAAPTVRRGALAVVRFLWTQGDAGRPGLRKVLAAGMTDPAILPYTVDELARLCEPWMTEEIRKAWLDPVRRTDQVKTAVLYYARCLPEPERAGFYKWLDAHP